MKLLGVDNVQDNHSVLGVEGKLMLVSVGIDGATVNAGRQSDLRGQMLQQCAFPWVFWSWCYSHCLEVACKDSFTRSQFTSMQQIDASSFVLPLHKSPKSHPILLAF